MDFVTAIKACLSKYATFTGRARRSEFWFFILFGLLSGMAASIVDMGFLGRWPNEFRPITALTNLFLLLPTIAVQVRRLHDKDYSGWWFLLWFLPIIGWIVLVVWNAQRGTLGHNRFGADPIETAATNAIT